MRTDLSVYWSDSSWLGSTWARAAFCMAFRNFMNSSSVFERINLNAECGVLTPSTSSRYWGQWLLISITNLKTASMCFISNSSLKATCISSNVMSFRVSSQGALTPDTAFFLGFVAGILALHDARRHSRVLRPLTLFGVV